MSLRQLAGRIFYAFLFCASLFGVCWVKLKALKTALSLLLLCASSWLLVTGLRVQCVAWKRD